MTTYVKASDSVIAIVDKTGKELQVTQRAYDLVYKAKGYRPINAVEGDEGIDFSTATREELNDATVKELKEHLDKEEIEFPSTAKKEDLINLILGE